MKFDTDGNCYLAKSPADFDGWTILEAVRFKPGVQRVYCKRQAATDAEFRTVYVNDDVTPWAGVA